MSQQIFATVRKVKRMDVVAQENERTAHEETLSNARRACKKAQRATKLAQTLVDEINQVI